MHLPAWLTFPNNWIFETIKLVASLAGALLVAWLTVKLALGRYKHEKAWERKLEAYCDLIASLGELHTAQADLNLQLDSRGIFTPEEIVELWSRFGNARSKVVQSRTMSILLLPKESTFAVSNLLNNIDASASMTNDSERFLYLLSEIERTLESVSEQGRRTLGTFEYDSPK